MTYFVLKVLISEPVIAAFLYKCRDQGTGSVLHCSLWH